MSEPEATAGLRNPKVMIAAIFLAVVVIAGAVTLALAGRDSNPEPTPPASPSDPPETSPQDDHPAEGACGLDPGPQAIPETAPEHTEWELVNGFAAPHIEGIGPGVEDDDGLLHCFAHSPTGALLATANYWAMAALDPANALDARLVVDSPEVRAARDDLESSEPADALGSGLQIAGFRIPTASDQEVTVELVIRNQAGEFFELTHQVQWDGGTWRVIYPSPEDLDIRPLNTMAEHVNWSGV